MWESRHNSGEEFDAMFQTLSDYTYHVLLIKPQHSHKSLKPISQSYCNRVIPVFQLKFGIGNWSSYF